MGDVVAACNHGEVAALNFPYPETNISMQANEKIKFFQALDKE